MVASHNPSSRPAGTRTVDRRIGLRPASSRSQAVRMIGGCRDQRPQLRLIVDNAACGADHTVRSGLMDHLGTPERVHGEPTSVAQELWEWLKASAGLAEARWRLARQQWVNRYGHFGLTSRMADLGPIVALATVVVFGGLLGLRLAQESSSGSTAALDGVAGSVAAVATSTSSAVSSSTSGAADSMNLPASPGPDSAVVVVHPGDSLWSIAVSRYPDHDPRAVVDAFVDANGASTIRSGQQLIVPAALLEG